VTCRRWGMGVLLAAVSVSAAEAQRLSTPAHVRAGVIVSPDPVRAGDTVEVWMLLSVENGWHIGWRNPGETGLPTRIVWQWPAAVHILDETWPRPQVVRSPMGVTHQLTGDVGIRVRIRVPLGTTATALPIKAEIRLGACKDVCIPERVSAEGILLLGASASSRASIAALVPAGVRAQLAEWGGALPVVEQGSTLCVRTPLFLRTAAVDLIADTGTGYVAARRLGPADRRGYRRAEVTRDSGRVVGTPLLLLTADRAVTGRATRGARQCR
jgi:hypothetical protein